MKKKLTIKSLQLFVINDYDTGKPMSYYLTDNANKCYEILSDIDGLDTDYQDKNGNYVKDDWEDYFIKRCRLSGVYIKKIGIDAEYDY